MMWKRKYVDFFPNLVPQIKSWYLEIFFHIFILQKLNPLFEKINKIKYKV